MTCRDPCLMDRVTSPSSQDPIIRTRFQTPMSLREKSTPSHWQCSRKQLFALDLCCGLTSGALLSDPQLVPQHRKSPRNESLATNRLMRFDMYIVLDIMLFE